MRRNLIVLGGVAIVSISKMFLPLISETVDGVETFLSPRSYINIIILILVLFFMVFKWTARGLLWILLGLTGAITVPSTMIAIVRTFREINIALSLDTTSSYGEPTYLPGMYVLIFGYIVIVGGGIWDLIQKMKPKPSRTGAETIYPGQLKPYSSGEEKLLSFSCDFMDGRHEVIGLPETETATIGCGSTDDILTSPDRSTVSQAVVKRAKKFYYLDVLDTTFPTTLNRQLITKARKLSPGDTITVGDVSILIRMSA